MNKLVENNDKQTIEAIIQEVTNITNSIINNISDSETLEQEIVKDTERNLELIKEELTNIGYSIQWAKAGFINSWECPILT